MNCPNNLRACLEPNEKSPIRQYSSLGGLFSIGAVLLGRSSADLVRAVAFDHFTVGAAKAKSC